MASVDCEAFCPAAGADVLEEKGKLNLNPPDGGSLDAAAAAGLPKLKLGAAGLLEAPNVKGFGFSPEPSFCASPEAAEALPGAPNVKEGLGLSAAGFPKVKEGFTEPSCLLAVAAG